jgi:hypothetical protein
VTGWDGRRDVERRRIFRMRAHRVRLHFNPALRSVLPSSGGLTPRHEPRFHISELLTMKSTNAAQIRRRELLRQMDAIVRELQLLDLQDGRSPTATRAPSTEAGSDTGPLLKKGDRVRVTSTHDMYWYLQVGTIKSARGSHFWNVLMDPRPGDSQRVYIYRTAKYLELLPPTD